MVRPLFVYKQQELKRKRVQEEKKRRQLRKQQQLFVLSIIDQDIINICKVIIFMYV